MKGETNNLIKVCLSSSASILYCYFISSMIPKGKFRLLSLLPIIFLFILLPLFLSYLSPKAITSLFISWLANFKLLLFAFHQGPLSHHPHKSLVQFISMAILPIEIKQNESYPSSPDPPKPIKNSSSKPPRLPLNWPTKVLPFTILVSFHGYKDHMHPNMVLVLHCCMLY
ncbi:hypothetical protein P3X46_006569 [Hevea brasiliensis]|uniref:Uncharacterized protein n=1 Tax=Hevea brasiliensis TaxID=3981 RepID=A0ABQ9MUG0_HEVBR|nr:hypothetical protein P3X46_006569 [Hevea brasiliensis]